MSIISKVLCGYEVQMGMYFKKCWAKVHL